MKRDPKARYKVREVPLGPVLEAARDAGALEPDCRAFRVGECNVLVGQIPDDGWHISISHPHRYPTWDEIVEARYALVPDEVTMAMFLPPMAEYVALHPNVFHLHEAARPKTIVLAGP